MKTENDKFNAGEPYLLGDIDLKKDRRKAKNLLHRLNVTEYRMTKTARLILGELLPNAGKNLYVEPPFFCDYGYNIFCPGVTVGKGCVIGAGSVVTKDIPDHSMAAGNPAKVIKKLNQ